VNLSYQGRGNFLTDVPEVSGNLLVAVRCVVGNRRDQEVALLDTGSPWCILPPALAVELGYSLETDGDTLLHTRFGLLAGELLRLPVFFVADDGAPAEIEATWFLSPEWPGTLVIGWKGCLERLRFAFEPRENDFYFAEY
jgi:hypothetical protein